MTDKERIKVLEKTFEEKDVQIRQLQLQNAELEDVLESYKNIDDEMKELQELIQKGREMTAELDGMNGEYNQMKKNFRRDMMNLFKRQRKF